MTLPFPWRAMLLMGVALASLCLALWGPETVWLVTPWRSWSQILSGVWLVWCVGRLDHALTRRRTWQGSDAWTLPVERLPRVRSHLHGGVYVGETFRWTGAHTQQLDTLLTTTGSFPLGPPPRGGYPILHAVGQRQARATVLPWAELGRHVGLVGAPGSGKTSELEVLVSEAIRGATGEPKPGAVLVIDPKGSRTLLARTAAEASRHGRPFALVTPAFPQYSTAFNVLGTCTEASDVAERVRALMPDAGGRSHTPFFEQYPLAIIEHIAAVQQALGIPWTLEGVFRATVFRAQMGRLLEQYLDLLGIPKTKSGEVGPRIKLYEKAQLDDTQADALIEDYQHDAQHFREVTGNLLPAFRGLLGYPLGPLFSSTGPDTLTWQRITEEGMVVYVALASMRYGELANRIGRVILQDLVGHLGARYAHTDVTQAPSITVFVDELRQVLYPGFLTALAMAREARCRWVVAMQSLADPEAALGSAAARVLLDNCNTRLYFQLADGRTAREVAQDLDTCLVQRPATGVGLGYGGVSGLHGNAQRRLESREEPLVRPAWLQALPIGEFYGRINGIACKGRVPLLTPVPQEILETLGLVEMWESLDPTTMKEMTYDTLGSPDAGLDADELYGTGDED